MPLDPYRKALAAALAALATRAAAFADLRGGVRLGRLWRDLDSYSRHVRKRIGADDVADADALAEHAFAMLADAGTVTIALAGEAVRTTVMFRAASATGSCC